MVLPHCTLLPHGLLPLHIFETPYRTMLEDVLQGERMMCVVMRKDPEEEEDAIYDFGTAGIVRACVRNPDGSARLLLQGLRRARFTRWSIDTPYPLADLEWMVTEIHDFDACSQITETLVRQACKLADAQGSHVSLCEQLRLHLVGADDPEQIADLLAFNFIRCPKRMQEIVESPVLDARLHILREELAKLS